MDHHGTKRLKDNSFNLLVHLENLIVLDSLNSFQPWPLEMPKMNDIY